MIRVTATEARKLGLPALKPKKQPRPDRTLFVRLCKEHGLPEPIPEYQFAPPRKWRADWAFLDIWDVSMWPCKVLVEIEGGIFGIGKPCPVCKRRRPAGHTSIQRLKEDIEKYNEAALAGWYLIRCLPADVEANGRLWGWLRRIAGLE